jgi:pyruvate/2-oxoglutarate dehydrogenase complex dihydrolipoamide dehydrogenase (E3) component
MQASITAAERGHDVTLCEKTGALGGALKFAEYVSFKDDLHRFRRYLEHMVAKAKVKVMLNTTVTPELVRDISPDVLIAAVGAEPIIPSLPGIDGDNVVLAVDVHNEGVSIGDRVVIIGGGLVGCETGLHLAQTGRDVTIIEMLSDVARDANVQHRTALIAQLNKYAKVYTEMKCTGITSEGVLATGVDGVERLYKADTVIISVGVKSLSDTVEQLRNKAPDFLWIGDCVKPQKVTEAIKSGYDATLDI